MAFTATTTTTITGSPARPEPGSPGENLTPGPPAAVRRPDAMVPSAYHAYFGGCASVAGTLIGQPYPYHLDPKSSES